MRIFGTLTESRFWIFFANIVRLLTAKHEQETAIRNFPRGRDVMTVSPTGIIKKHDFYRVLLFVVTRQELMSTRTTLLNSNFRNIVELHSNGIVICCLRPFLVWGLRSDDKTRGHWQKAFASVWIIIRNFDRGLPWFVTLRDLDKVLHGNA